MLQTIRFCYRKNIPWYLMSESWARRTGLRGWAKDRWLRSLLQTAKGGLPAGQLASLRLKELGIPVERQSQLPNVPDIDRLFALGNKRRVKSGEHKAELGLRANDKVILFAARMIDKKRPLLVLEVLQKLDNPTYKLVMLGDGPMMVNIRDFIRTHKLESQTITCGFVDIEVVYDWMSIADVFLQPSSETWGVAPIEAVALGCRVIISAETGCAPELSSMPGNTVRVIKRDRESLAASIESILANDFAYTQTTYPDTCWLFRSRYSELASNLTQFLQQS
jgi:glycosyltransferase involved in cell wall biosynthesis